MEQCEYCPKKVDCDGCIWPKVISRLKPRPKHKIIVVSTPTGSDEFYDRYKHNVRSSQCRTP